MTGEHPLTIAPYDWGVSTKTGEFSLTKASQDQGIFSLLELPKTGEFSFTKAPQDNFELLLNIQVNGCGSSYRYLLKVTG